jgi:anti-sigma factor RsiW
MSECRRIESLLEAHHDGELGIWERGRVHLHLWRCEPCRARRATLSRVGLWVRAAVETRADPDLWSAIEARLPVRARDPEPGSTPFLRWPTALPALGAAAVAAAAAGLLLRTEPLAVPEGVVRSLNTHGRPVMVLEEPDEPTVIWLMDEGREQRVEESTGVWI